MYVGEVLFKSINKETGSTNDVHKAFVDVMALIMSAPYLHTTPGSSNLLIVFLGLMNIGNDGKTLHPARKCLYFCFSH